MTRAANYENSLSMKASHIQSYPIHSTQRVPAWPLIVVLAILFLGPLVAPLFQATGVPWVADSGALARDVLSRYVCPTPAKSYMLLGFPMAVCARCWGATIGLWAAWLLIRARRGARGPRVVAAYQALGWPLHVVLAIGALLIWTLEISSWPGAPLAVLLLNGAHGGFWAGLCAFALLARVRAV